MSYCGLLGSAGASVMSVAALIIVLFCFLFIQNHQKCFGVK